jgi:predicted GNAT superfamily acetyltransferase
MALELREARDEDLDALLALNNSAGPGILPVDAERLSELLDFAAYFRIAVVDGVVAGFLIALDAHSEYDSLNYRWFQDRFPAFIYIDRIVIGRPFRRLGLGRVFYADVQSFSEVRSPLLTCEVFLDPRDDVSVLFHGTYGFREEGQQTLPSGHRVSLLAKELCSFPWVRDRYARDGNLELPLQPWLAAREQCPGRRAQARDNAA